LSIHKATTSGDQGKNSVAEKSAKERSENYCSQDGSLKILHVQGAILFTYHNMLELQSNASTAITKKQISTGK
jgi:hypothetical protein